MDENSILCAYMVDSNAISEKAIEYAKLHQLMINCEYNGQIGSYRMVDCNKSLESVNEFEIRIDDIFNTTFVDRSGPFCKALHYRCWLHDMTIGTK